MVKTVGKIKHHNTGGHKNENSETNGLSFSGDCVLVHHDVWSECDRNRSNFCGISLTITIWRT